MARVIDRLWVRVAAVILAVQAVLLPLLFYGLSIIVRESQADAFTDQVRSSGRLLADQRCVADIDPDLTE